MPLPTRKGKAAPQRSGNPAGCGRLQQLLERVRRMCRSQRLGSALQKIQEMKFQLREKKKKNWHYCQERNLVVQLLEPRQLFHCFRV